MWIAEDSGDEKQYHLALWPSQSFLPAVTCLVFLVGRSAYFVQYTAAIETFLAIIDQSQASIRDNPRRQKRLYGWIAHIGAESSRHGS